MKGITVTTSWDDGHVLDMRLAALLREYGIRGTFYISPEDREIDGHDRLSEEQVLELSSGFEIGAHTMTHPRLAALDEEVSRKEILGSKTYLEDLLKKPVTSFCYPGGSYTALHRTIAKQAGFTLARTVECFRMEVGDDPFSIPTTVHAYRHWSHLVPITRRVGPRRLAASYLNWDELAIVLFDDVLARGGVFHLWGHSWEIDAKGDWQRLRRVLQHISNRSGVNYRENRELI